MQRLDSIIRSCIHSRIQYGQRRSHTLGSRCDDSNTKTIQQLLTSCLLLITKARAFVALAASVQKECANNCAKCKFEICPSQTFTACKVHSKKDDCESIPHTVMHLILFLSDVGWWWRKKMSPHLNQMHHTGVKHECTNQIIMAACHSMIHYTDCLQYLSLRSTHDPTQVSLFTYWLC